MRARCIGFGPLEGNCPNEAGSTHSALWCQSCDEARRRHLDSMFARIRSIFEGRR